MQEYAINTLTKYKAEELQVGMTVAIVEYDAWNNERLVTGVVTSMVQTDSGEVLTICVKNEVTLRAEEVEVKDVQTIFPAFIANANKKPKASKKVPNELHYVDVQLRPTVMKVGNSYNGSGEVVKAITLEENGMAVVHGENGIIAVIKSNYLEIYYV